MTRSWVALSKLRQLGWEESTDIIITQEHNHSTVSGDIAHFPLRAIVDNDVGPRIRMATPFLVSCGLPRC